MREIFIYLLLLSLFVSCGKKLENSSDSDDPGRSGQSLSVELENSMKNEKLWCAEGFCPSYLAKVVIHDGRIKRTCPAIYLGRNRVLSAASCLPRRMQVKNFKCEKNVMFSFIDNYRVSQRNQRCQKITYVSQLNSNSVVLQDEDIVIFKVAGYIPIAKAILGYKGMGIGDTFNKWDLEKKNGAHYFKVDRCKRVLNSYANPFADKKESSFQLLSGCDFDKLSLGSAILNSKRYLVGIGSSLVNKSIGLSLKKQGLLSEEALSLSYATNLACVRNPLFYSMEGNPNKCFTKKDIYELDRKRKHALTSLDVHRKNIQKVKNEIEFSKKYFRWNFDFYSNKRTYSLETFMDKPSCYFGIKKWIKEFKKRNSVKTKGYIKLSRKNYRLATKFNRYLIPSSELEELEEKEYKIKINPYKAFYDGFTPLEITSELHGSDFVLSYDEVFPCTK